MKGGILLGQGAEDDEHSGFDDNWIIEFRRDNQATMGLIWAGSIQETRREAG
ncbi:hypothetical protein [Tautonia plasticadhaerens]|uniref:Uncharacterized protein n=1 Tax=Tautonia plasticadhaerens TaxID=2527974 RepID=A0A518H7V1_9BACT|nr:hypothetical protein [Tautonia plasticadhaerens]QDV36932.1 hypothetical protein ElP_48620 [Tautonia plasticadhaerens]